MAIKEGTIKQSASRLIVLFLADLLFPRQCVVCEREGEWLCAPCRAKLGFLPRQTCLLCGADNGGKICVSHNLFIDKFFSAFSYRDEAVNKLIKLFKYHFSREAGETIAELLIDFLSAENNKKILKLLDHLASRGDLLVLAVPLSSRRERWRGFNQAELLAKIIADNFDWSFDRQNLIRTKHTKPQAELSAFKRQTNLTKAFVWRGENLAGQAVLLIDDVATTGATLNECARALKAAGASQVYGLTIAHG
jgi:ComF family protein